MRNRLKMYKRLILVLAISMLIFSLAGCGREDQGSAEVNEESAVDDSAADSASTSADSAAAVQTGLREEEEYDYKPAELACSLPKGFVASSSEEGMYLHKSYPKDLSAISYDISDTTEDITKMTMDEYKNIIEEDFLTTYGDAVSVNISTYENIILDHRNGLKIKMSYNFKDTDYEQLTFLFFNGTEIHNLTFTQEGDHDWMEEFESCAANLHFVEMGN